MKRKAIRIRQLCRAKAKKVALARGNSEFDVDAEVALQAKYKKELEEFTYIGVITKLIWGDAEKRKEREKEQRDSLRKDSDRKTSRKNSTDQTLRKNSTDQVKV